jgi:acyl carrier protein
VAEDTKARIRSYIQRLLPGHTLRDDEDMFALGFVNSLFALQLVLFIEQEFGITIDSDDLEIDKFRTIDALAQFVESKTSASQ